MDKVRETPINDDSKDEKWNIYVGVAVSFSVVFLTVLILWLWKKHRPTRNGVLLLGLCDSGKTLLFARLLHDKFVATYTSVRENSGEATWNNRLVKVVDIPGHERLRGKFFDQYKSMAKALVFVVDSVTIQKEVRDVAEFLYIILADPAISSARPSVLILCNKQDVTMAKGSGVVKSLLEKEILSTHFQEHGAHDQDKPVGEHGRLREQQLFLGQGR
ncbi:signal recognition particle receptor subunit beta isoform X2 [Bacillus rossius redtenbacheri]|uniref:signal recognition particle receptor subunit beta isoform X2 n=1 Tax=Bacillus rossius redtenbacheri TaxID=93214 RepID=UPI002FDDF266